MDNLLYFYQRERVRLERHGRQWAARYPDRAIAMGWDGSRSGDPDLNRLFEAACFINASTAQQLDDDDRQLSEALLGLDNAMYLRPFPSCAVACFDFEAGARQSGGVQTIKRGTALESIVAPSGQPCRYRTVYDVTVAPVRLSTVRYSKHVDMAPSLRLAAGVTSAMSIVIDTHAAAPGLAQLGLSALRIHLAGADALCGALRDALLARVAGVYLELGEGPGWLALEGNPFKAVGFDNDESLLPCAGSRWPAYRLLAEYANFPAKFNFVDLDWLAIAAHCEAGCRRITLHVMLREAAVARQLAQPSALAALSAKNCLLGCTPLVNLFSRQAVPIELAAAPEGQHGRYRLQAEPGNQGAACDIYSIDAMHIVKPGAHIGSAPECRPYLSSDHFVAPGTVVHFWRVRHDRLTLPDGRRIELSLCDADQRPMANESGTLFAELTCSNGGLPATLPYGRSGGDLCAKAVPGEYPIQLLGRSSPPRRFMVDGGNHWRLLSGQSLQVQSLSTAGLPAFKAMLAAHALDASGGPCRQFAGIVDLCHELDEARMPATGAPMFRTGLMVRMTLDETAFTGSSLQAFALVIERLLGLYVHTNSFTRLLLISHQSGAQLLCCEPRQGSLELM